MHVFIFSYTRLFAESLSASLRQREGISEVKISCQANQLINQVTEDSPDILLIDFATERSLIESRSICQAIPGLPIVGISVPEIVENVIACADAGLVGYVPRQASIDELFSCMLMALKGECNCSPRIAASLLQEIRTRQKVCDEGSISEPLTYRECEILQLVGSGFSNKQIAIELTLSVATVKNHLHNIFNKCHAHSRAELLVHLRNQPWIVNVRKACLIN